LYAYKVCHYCTFIFFYGRERLEINFNIYFCCDNRTVMKHNL